MKPKPLKTTIEGLPTEGAMGENPAVTIGGVVTFCTIVAAAAAVFLHQSITPEQQVFFDHYGLTLAAAIVALIPIIQGFLTRARAFSPHSVATRYVDVTQYRAVQALNDELAQDLKAAAMDLKASASGPGGAASSPVPHDAGPPVGPVPSEGPGLGAPPKRNSGPIHPL